MTVLYLNRLIQNSKSDEPKFSVGAKTVSRTMLTKVSLIGKL